MRTTICFLLLGSALLLTSAPAQEKVTIPKSRLEELERKEAELERLKAGTQPNRPAVATAPSATSEKTPGALSATPTATPAVARPAVASLPPVQPGQRISSAELVSQFLADPANAELRYRKQDIVVEGRVLRISKQLLRREYELVLEGPQAGQEVVCRLRAPDQYEAIYTAKSGAELVGTAHGLTTVLARTGTTAAVRGRCKGLKGAQVQFAGEAPTP